MGDYIKETFARMNIQDIREFLLCGVEEYNFREEPYVIQKSFLGRRMFGLSQSVTISTA